MNGTKKAKALTIQPQLLRVARCYRTVSDAAALVLARMPPAFLLALGRKRISEGKRSLPIANLRASECRATIVQWQELWSVTTMAEWTRRVIPDIIKWWYRGPKAITFHMAQVLSGQGCFQKYLLSRGRAREATCPHCEEPNDTVEHTLFACLFWEYARAELSSTIG